MAAVGTSSAGIDDGGGMRLVTHRYLARRFGLSAESARDVIQRRTLHAMVLSWATWAWLALAGAGIGLAYASGVEGMLILGLIVLALLGWSMVARVVAEHAIIDTARRLSARLHAAAPDDHGEAD